MREEIVEAAHNANADRQLIEERLDWSNVCQEEDFHRTQDHTLEPGPQRHAGHTELCLAGKGFHGRFTSSGGHSQPMFLLVFF